MNGYQGNRQFSRKGGGATVPPPSRPTLNAAPTSSAATSFPAPQPAAVPSTSYPLPHAAPPSASSNSPRSAPAPAPVPLYGNARPVVPPTMSTAAAAPSSPSPRSAPPPSSFTAAPGAPPPPQGMIAQKLAGQQQQRTPNPALPSPVPPSSASAARPPLPPSAASFPHAASTRSASSNQQSPPSGSPLPVHTAPFAPPSRAVPSFAVPSAPRPSLLEDDWGQDGSDAAFAEHFGKSNLTFGSRRMLVAGSQLQQQQRQQPTPTYSAYRPPPFELTQKPTRAASTVAPPPPQWTAYAAAAPLTSPDAPSPPDSARRSYMTDEDDDEFIAALDPAILHAPAPSFGGTQPRPAPALPQRQPMPLAPSAVRPLPAASDSPPVSPAKPPPPSTTPTKRRYDDVDAGEAHEVAQRRAAAAFAASSMAAQPRPDPVFQDHLRHLVAAPHAAVAARGSSAASAASEVPVKKELTETEQRLQEQLIRIKKELATQKREAKATENAKAAKEAEVAILRSRLKAQEAELTGLSIASSAKLLQENKELKVERDSRDRQVKSLAAEKDMLEMQLREMERAKQQHIKQERDRAKLPQHPPTQLSQLSAQTRRTASVAPAPAQAPLSLSAAVPMETADDSLLAAAVKPVAAEREAAAVMNDEPLSPLPTSLIPFPPTEGQTLIEQLLLPSSDGGGSLWTFLRALNAFLTLQGAASPISFSLLNRLMELESLITAVQEGKLSPTAFLSPICHLLQSLCSISMVSADLSSLALIPRESGPAVLPGSTQQPPGQRMRATDDIILQLVHVLLILLTASPACRKAAMKPPPREDPVPLRVPSSYRPHPLAKGLSSPRFFLRVPAPVGKRRSREQDDELMAGAEKAGADGDAGMKNEADAARSAASVPELLPLLLGLVEYYQRAESRMYSDVLLQPILRLLLLLLESSLGSLPSFLPLLSDSRLFPLLRLSTPASTRCLAVQLFALCLNDPSTLQFFPHPVPSPSHAANAPVPPSFSLLHSLYASFIDGDDDDTPVHSRQRPPRFKDRERRASHPTTQHERAVHSDGDAEARLYLRLHVVWLMSFVMARYGDEGIRWLANERPEPQATDLSAAGDGADEKAQSTTVVVELEPDKYSLLGLLVQLCTAEMATIRAEDAADGVRPPSSSQPPLSHSLEWLYRDRRIDALTTRSQPGPSDPASTGTRGGARAGSAASAVRVLRVQVVVEAFRVLCHLTFSCIPAPLRSPPLSLAAQLMTCRHMTQALLTTISSSTEPLVAALGQDASALRAALSGQKLLEPLEEDSLW